MDASPGRTSGHAALDRRPPAKEGSRSVRSGFRAALWFVVMVMTMIWGWPAAHSPAAKAADGGGFTVSGISVDVMAFSPAEARRRAFAKAEAEAVRQLLERLVAPVDHGLLPSVIDEQARQRLIRDVAVEEEKTATAHYIARLSVHFRPAAVRAYLRAINVPYVEPPTRPILIIPLFQAAPFTASRLLDEDNPWRMAWQRQMGTDSLIPVIVPPGDSLDRNTLSPEQVMAGDSVALDKMVRRMRAERAVVVQATGAKQAGRLSGVDVQILPPHDMLPSLAEHVAAASGDDMTAVLDKAVQVVTGWLEADWRQYGAIRAAVGQGKGRELTVMVPVDSLAEWLAIRHDLGRVRLIVRTSVQALTRTMVQLHLQYAGEETQLTAVLAQQGLKLDGHGPVRRLVRTTTGASRVPSDRGG